MQIIRYLGGRACGEVAGLFRGYLSLFHKENEILSLSNTHTHTLSLTLTLSHFLSLSLFFPPSPSFLPPIYFASVSMRVMTAMTLSSAAVRLAKSACSLGVYFNSAAISIWYLFEEREEGEERGREGMNKRKKEKKGER